MEFWETEKHSGRERWHHSIQAWTQRRMWADTSSSRVCAESTGKDVCEGFHETAGFWKTKTVDPKHVCKEAIGSKVVVWQRISNTASVATRLTLDRGLSFVSN